MVCTVANFCNSVIHLNWGLAAFVVERAGECFQREVAEMILYVGATRAPASIDPHADAASGIAGGFRERLLLP